MDHENHENLRPQKICIHVILVYVETDNLLNMLLILVVYDIHVMQCTVST